MEFDRITTERMTVRRLVTADAEPLAYYRSLPQVTRFQSAYSQERAEILIREMNDSHPSVAGKWFQFAIELTSEDLLIGDIGFLNSDENGKSWIGFTLNPDYWHKGYAAEAVRAVLEYYAKLGISTVWASTDPENYASMKLLKNLKFTLVESKPDDVVFMLGNTHG